MSFKRVKNAISKFKDRDSKARNSYLLHLLDGGGANIFERPPIKFM